MNSANPLSGPHEKASLRTIGLMYFFMYAAIGAYFTYIAVFYRSVGLSGTQIGLINMCAGIVAFFSSTGWGYLSDRTAKPHIIMAAAAGTSAAIALLMPFAHTFVPLLLLGCVYAAFNTAIVTLMDSTTLALLGANRADYGRYRIGGTIGYIVTTLSVGFIFQRFGLVWMFPTFAAIELLFAVAALRLKLKTPPAHSQTRSVHAILNMVRQPAWLIFALTVFILWFCGSGAISFVGITLKSMGASDPLIGMVASSAAVFELPFMAYNSYLLRKLGSSRMLWLSTFGYVARIGLYSFMPSPAWGIAVNALNGVSYVFLWNASISYASENAPDHLKATAQGLFISTTALAGVASSLFSGWLYDLLGPPGLFRVLSLICVSAVIIFGIFGHKPAPKPSPA